MKSVFDDPDEIKDDPEIKKLIGQFTSELRRTRIEKELSQIELGRRSKISQKSISEIESGGIFRIDTYIRLFRAMGVIPEVRLRYRAKKKASDPHTPLVSESEGKENS